jgi:O-antigen ligase
VTRTGYISDEDRQKNEAQSQGGNLLLGGRPEFAVGLRAALDAPLIGHGSWADDPKYMELLGDLVVAEGAADPAFGRLIANAGGTVIPSHSHVVGAWVFAGVFGLIFWLYIISLVLRGLVRLTASPPMMAPICMWLLITMFWDICFSPFASFRRLIEAFLLIVIADLPQMKSRLKHLHSV